MSTTKKLLCLTLLTAACGAVPEADDEFAATEDALSTRSNAFVTLRRDVRRCVSPLCGGYFAKDVNRRTAEVYVSGFDFSQSGLDEATQAILRDAPDGELVVRGRLGKQERTFKTRPLLVIEAYRGLPGQRVAPGDAFYQVTDMRPLIRCAAAPCNGLTAHKLATSGRTSFTSFAWEPATAPLVDPWWLETRVTQHGGIVTGHFERGQRFPAGYEKLLEASQVFVRLPEAAGPCEPQPLARCAEGFVHGFERDGDRCLVSVGCVEARMCTLQVPSCDEGYTLRSWTGPNGGCTAYACDPEWSVPSER